MSRPVIFAQTRHEYQSYTDFWRLVALEGYPTCYLDEIRYDADAVYIFSPFNGEVPPHFRNEAERVGAGKVASIVWWNLERPDANDVPLAKALDEAAGLFDHAWVSDRLVATLDSRLQHAVLGGHPCLRAGGESEEKRYDFCHMSYAWGRRAQLYSWMSERGYAQAPCGWGDERAQILAASRVLVNAQQYHMPVVAPLRFVLGAAFRMPLLSEALHDPYPLAREDLVEAGYGQPMVEALGAMLANLQHRLELGERLYQRFCVEWTFRKGVDDALDRAGIRRDP